MSAPEGSLSTSTSALGAPAGGRGGGAASTISATGSDVEGEAAPDVTFPVGGDGLGGTPSAATRRSTPEVAASSAAEPDATPAASCSTPRSPGGPAAAAAAATASAIDELVGVGGSVLVTHGGPSTAAEAWESPPSDADERAGHPSAVGCTASGGADAAALGGDGGTPLRMAEAAVGSTADGNTGLDAAVAATDGGGEALDDRGEAPLHAAARNGEVESIAALVDGGAGLLTRTANGDMALHVAVSSRQLPALELLLRMGSDGHSGIGGRESTIDVTGANGQTGLCVAADAGWTEGADLLLKCGASASAVDDSGATPLHWAATGGHIDIVEMLVNAGASATVVDGCGRTPDDWAASSGYLKSFQRAVQRCQARRAASRAGGGGGGSRVNVGGGGYAST